MPLSEEVLKKLIKPNAKALSSPNGDKYIENASVGKLDDFDDSMFLAETYAEPTSVSNNSGYLTDDTATKMRAATNYSSNNFNPERVKSTKMSSTILHEMTENPIDTTALNAMMLESAGNGNSMVNNDKLNKMLAGAKRVEEAMGTTVRSPQISRNTNAGVGIDYALIKTIVNECLEQKLGELAEKGLLNESTTLKGIGLSEGKIKLIDNKGNVFQAKLEYKGNAKEKK